MSVETLEAGGMVKVISGQTDQGTKGPVKNSLTEPLYLDVHLGQGATFQQDVPDTHGGFIYVIEGTVRVGVKDAELSARTLGVLGDGDKVEVSSMDANSRFLVIAGRRLNEPVAREMLVSGLAAQKLSIHAVLPATSVPLVTSYKPGV
jgi:redox-sensitive bicupin YhaK (pirin superfamily)